MTITKPYNSIVILSHVNLDSLIPTIHVQIWLLSLYAIIHKLAPQSQNSNTMLNFPHPIYKLIITSRFLTINLVITQIY